MWLHHGSRCHIINKWHTLTRDTSTAIIVAYTLHWLGLLISDVPIFYESKGTIAGIVLGYTVTYLHFRNTIQGPHLVAVVYQTVMVLGPLLAIASLPNTGRSLTAVSAKLCMETKAGNHEKKFLGYLQNANFLLYYNYYYHQVYQQFILRININ